MEYGALIRYLFLKNKTNDIKTEINDVNEDNATSISITKYWTAGFKQEITSMFDEERPGLLTKNS